MNESASVICEPSFNRSLKVRSRDDRITSDAGVVLLREVDALLGLTDNLARVLTDERDPNRIRYTIDELLRERIYAMSLGYAAADDCDRLAHDPAFRVAVWGRSGQRSLAERLASQPTQSRLLDMLAQDGNLELLKAALADWTERYLLAAGANRWVMRGTIDIDGLPSVVHGNQEGGAFNGYYGKTVYSPLVASFAPYGNYDSRRLGDGFVGLRLRKGNASSSEGALDFIRQTHRRCSDRARALDVRLDAGFTVGEVLDGLTSDEIPFVGRLRGNKILHEKAQGFVYRGPGRPSLGGREYTNELGSYQAESWENAQRVVICVIDKPDPLTGQLALSPRYFFLVTPWSKEQMNGKHLLEHYRRIGTFEDRLGELEGAIRPRLSSPNFQENEAILTLALLSFNLLNILRGEMEGIIPSGWDLARLQTTVLKTGARIVTSARRIFIDIALAATPYWRILMSRMQRWKLPERFTRRPHPVPQSRWVPPPSHAHHSLAALDAVALRTQPIGNLGSLSPTARENAWG